MKAKAWKMLDKLIDWLERRTYEQTYKQLEEKHIELSLEKEAIEDELRYLRRILEERGIGYHVRY